MSATASFGAVFFSTYVNIAKNFPKLSLKQIIESRLYAMMLLGEEDSCHLETFRAKGSVKRFGV